ncbi:hypothetical protein GOB36_15330 [Sinorhizobium meliloti]|uniref:hypothetical protein n=1 Tax=Rhizobium meliloti TaxID=382 RepID=UPI00299ECA91|nr:hypothetical protein [Sinorhizobium meliloti]MDX0033050.1 hypothetical protein [Sinorhizobium meliloti]
MIMATFYERGDYMPTSRKKLTIEDVIRSYPFGQPVLDENGRLRWSTGGRLHPIDAHVYGIKRIAESTLRRRIIPPEEVAAALLAVAKEWERK